MKPMLTLTAALLCLALATALAADVVPFGVCAHLGGGAEFNDHEQELTLMEEAGIRWARADWSWGYFEPRNDEWRFEAYDTIVESAKRHNVTLLPILCYNVDWAFPAHDHLDEWCDYVRTVVDRYKGDLKHWEVWNEPNIGFWKPQPDAAQYARLLIATYKTIKETDPDAQVVYGGTAGVPLTYIRNTFELGAFDAFDVLAIHPYRYPLVPETGRIVEDLQATWELVDEFGGGKKMWITEFGWPTHESGTVGDGTFPAQMIHYSAKLRFPEATQFKAAVLHEDGVPGCGSLGEIINNALNRLPDVTSATVTLDEIASLDPKQTQIFVMPTGEHFPADHYDDMLAFVREGGLLVHFGGVPFYYAQRKDENGNWKGPHAGEDAGRGPLHVGWKAWWTTEGVPETAGTTKLAVPDGSGINLPAGLKSTRWLTDEKLQGEDKFVPLLAAYNNDTLVGYPVALYLYDSDLKGAFLGAILDTNMAGVTEDTQALYLPRALLLSLGEGLENIFWYEFRNGGNDATYNEDRFGIINLDLSPKPAYKSYQALTRALGAGKFLEKLDVGEGNYCYIFDAGETKTAAVWRAEGVDQVRLVVSGDIKAFDYQGETVPSSAPEGELEVSAREEVTYVTGLESVEAMQ